MLKIRLQRVGRVHDTSFRLVLTDSKNSSKTGRFKEILGSYNPRKIGSSIDMERVKYWLSQGANPTSTVHNLLVKNRVINAKKIHVAAKSKKAPQVKAEEPITVTDTPQPEAPQETAPETSENATIEPVAEETSATE